MPSMPKTPLTRHTRSGRANHGGGYRPLRLALAFVVAIAAMMLFGVSTTDSASAAPKTGSVTTVVPTNQLPAGVSEAVVTVTDFANQGVDLVASGTATITDTAGNQDTQAFQGVDVLQADGTCEVLNLVLGPLHLDLLGLVIDLNQVVLNITAEQGSGNLLGNLVCAVAGLLDGPSPAWSSPGCSTGFWASSAECCQWSTRPGRETCGLASTSPLEDPTIFQPPIYLYIPSRAQSRE